MCAVLGSPVLVIGCGIGASLNFLLRKMFPRRCFLVYIASSTESCCSVFIVVDNCEMAVGVTYINFALCVLTFQYMGAFSAPAMFQNLLRVVWTGGCVSIIEPAISAAPKS